MKLNKSVQLVCRIVKIDENVVDWINLKHNHKILTSTVEESKNISYVTSLSWILFRLFYFYYDTMNEKMRWWIWLTSSLSHPYSINRIYSTCSA